ncbi:MAG: TonB-dependent receptor, partial [Acidobacteria bacterium]
MRRYRCFVFCALVLLASTTQIQGQSYQGGLRGAVTDPAGAVVPGAEVTLVNEQTNVGRTTLSNESGEYVFSFVPPGTYKLKVTLAGFKTYERPGINIGTQQFITLDVRLEVGAVSEQITVSASVPLIETSNANTGGLLSEGSLKDLPNTGRNPFMMALTIPNVLHTGDPFYVRMQDQTNSSLLSLGGGPIRGNNYLIDGVPITDLRNRAIFIPNIDALSEIKIQVNTYDAEMGRTGGGVINTTLKSGGNDWHGHVHLQQRPSAWAANNFFSNRDGEPKSEFFYWLWGGSAGGPIKKDKTFFWASNEGYHTGTVWTRVLTVPTLLQRAGDFSQTFDSQGNLVTIYDPLSTKADPNNPGKFIRTPFAGNKIPALRMNPTGMALMAFFPDPKRPG